MIAFWYSTKYKYLSIGVTAVILVFGNIELIENAVGYIPSTYRQQYTAAAGKEWYVGNVQITKTSGYKTTLVQEEVLFRNSDNGIHRGMVQLVCLNNADATRIGPISLNWMYTEDLKVDADVARSLCSYALIG